MLALLQANFQTFIIFLMIMGVGYSLKGNGSEEGIRTLEGLRPTRFPGVRLKPLGHLTAWICSGYTNVDNLSSG